MGNCWTHGDYIGGTCPHCTQESSAEMVTDAIAEQTAAIEAAARRHEQAEAETRQAVEKSAERHERAIAEDWKLRAEAKSVRAAELYQAGMWKEVADLAREAIAHDDAGNIKLQMYAAWALVSLGADEEARQFFNAQIRLLRVPRYQQSAATFGEVFEHLPHDPILLDEFDAAVIQGSSSWSVQNKLFVIELYISRNRLSSARQLLKVTRPTPNEVEAGAVCLLADVVEFGTRLGEPPDTRDVTSFFAAIPFSSRSFITRDFAAVLRRKDRYSRETLAIMSGAMRSRYGEWQPEIAGSITQQARAAAEAHSPSKRVIFWIAFGGYVAGTMLLAMLFNLLRLGDPSDAAPFGVLIMFPVTILMGIRVWRARRSNERRKVESETLTRLWDDEQTQWQGICGDVRPSDMKHKFCKHCGAQLDAVANFCVNCGKSAGSRAAVAGR